MGNWSKMDSVRTTNWGNVSPQNTSITSVLIYPTYFGHHFVTIPTSSYDTWHTRSVVIYRGAYCVKFIPTPFQHHYIVVLTAFRDTDTLGQW